MFGKDSESRKQGETETVIGPSVKVDGKFFGQGNVILYGKLSGSFKTEGDLHIEHGASVKASVEANNVFVAGEVSGNIKATDRLELAETAKITGDVEAKTVTIGAGAVMNGRCTMQSGSLTSAGFESNREQLQGNRPSKSGRKAEGIV